MKPLVVTSGEPAGIGPDICLDLAGHSIPLVVLGDGQLLKERAESLGKSILFKKYSFSEPVIPQENTLTVWHIPTQEKVMPAILNPGNANYVLSLLKTAVTACLKEEFSALVTAPVHKGVINQAGIPFTGHTEFLATACHCQKVVMMLACDQMKVALMTTHLPLREVADAITKEGLIETICLLAKALHQDFGLDKPKIAVAGLNPHAGEGGYLGQEEIQVIQPALHHLKAMGIEVDGPFSADTLFSPLHLQKYDVFLSMFHDQGLPVLKYAGFGDAVNISLGLPILRTSVDHGTALEFAASGKASSRSLIHAIEMANFMASQRNASH